MVVVVTGTVVVVGTVKTENVLTLFTRPAFNEIAIEPAATVPTKLGVALKLKNDVVPPPHEHADPFDVETLT